MAMMSQLLVLCAAALSATTLLTSPEYVVAKEVRFHSAEVPPSPLRMRLARERGETVAPEPAQEISGTLYRPDGQGPFSAVVVLHGCGGRSPAVAESENAKRFTALGYVALYVDSFTPRGVRHNCAGEGIAGDRVLDALGALEYLASRDFVRPDHVAVAGASQGGGVAISTVALAGPVSTSKRRFAAAVAYYPPCEQLNVYAPTLILIGELDDWTPASKCRDGMRMRTGAGAPVRLIVYPGAHHAFNARSLAGSPTTYFGHRLEYNEAADTSALSEVAQFLKGTIGR